MAWDEYSEWGMSTLDKTTFVVLIALLIVGIVVMGVCGADCWGGV